MSWSPKKSVLVPVDFSESSFRAVSTGLELVASPAQLHVIHVTIPINVTEPEMLWSQFSDAERLKAAEKELAQQLEQRGLNGVETHLTVGNAARCIVNRAAEVDAELIVMPSHGRSGFSRLFLGSVTEKVLRLATCEVLVLRVESDSKEE